MGAERMTTIGKLFIYIHNKYFIIETLKKKSKTTFCCDKKRFQTMPKENSRKWALRERKKDESDEERQNYKSKRK